VGFDFKDRGRSLGTAGRCAVVDAGLSPVVLEALACRVGDVAKGELRERFFNKVERLAGRKCLRRGKQGSLSLRAGSRTGTFGQRE
jgi:hypothetical protein